MVVLWVCWDVTKGAEDDEDGLGLLVRVCFSRFDLIIGGSVGGAGGGFSECVWLVLSN